MCERLLVYIGNMYFYIIDICVYNYALASGRISTFVIIYNLVYISSD